MALNDLTGKKVAKEHKLIPSTNHCSYRWVSYDSGVNTDKVVKAENAVNAASVGVDVNVESVGSIVTNVSTEKAENYEFGARDRIG